MVIELGLLFLDSWDPIFFSKVKLAALVVLIPKIWLQSLCLNWLFFLPVTLLTFDLRAVPLYKIDNGLLPLLGLPFAVGSFTLFIGANSVLFADNPGPEVMVYFLLELTAEGQSRLWLIITQRLLLKRFCFRVFAALLRFYACDFGSAMMFSLEIKDNFLEMLYLFFNGVPF